MSTDFALKWYRTVASQKTSGENMVISPLSMQALFNLAYQALNDEQAEREISTAVFGGLSRREVADIFTILSDEYNPRRYFDDIGRPKVTDDLVKRYTANVLVHSGTIEKEYKNSVVNCFSGIAMRTKTLQEGVKTLVNPVVSHITQGMINNAVDASKVQADSSLIMVNALFFNATWAHPFSKENDGDTYEDLFYLENMKKNDKNSKDAATISTTFMSMVGAFPFYENSNMKLLALNYTGNNHTMYFMIPKSDIEFDIFEQSLMETATFEEMRSKLELRETIVTLPKFSMSMELPAKASMQAMGLTKIFEHADLSNGFGATDHMGNSAPHDRIDMINHKVVLQVHESGTQGAAVSSMGAISTSLKASFKANRPFSFIVYDHSAETVMFIGRYVNPEKTLAANFM